MKYTNLIALPLFKIVILVADTLDKYNCTYPASGGSVGNKEISGVLENGRENAIVLDILPCKKLIYPYKILTFPEDIPKTFFNSSKLVTPIPPLDADNTPERLFKLWL